ncbi:hypothetical protein PROFUN_15864 [Planoprotostelium fungivorum]|uniref:Uncharacterized protein n=1 Tax=Planoprotostelium fungivorum TaxID=1890364 RepID=A0A2P6MU53_9EUKA|nr:hypothetical protein PROFUN_15864 [Planoprotostelium fungivorum]
MRHAITLLFLALLATAVWADMCQPGYVCKFCCISGQPQDISTCPQPTAAVSDPTCKSPLLRINAAKSATAAVNSVCRISLRSQGSAVLHLYRWPAYVWPSPIINAVNGAVNAATNAANGAFNAATNAANGAVNTANTAVKTIFGISGDYLSHNGSLLWYACSSPSGGSNLYVNKVNGLACTANYLYATLTGQSWSWIRYVVLSPLRLTTTVVTARHKYQDNLFSPQGKQFVLSVAHHRTAPISVKLTGKIELREFRLGFTVVCETNEGETLRFHLTSNAFHLLRDRRPKMRSGVGHCASSVQHRRVLPVTNVVSAVLPAGPSISASTSNSPAPTTYTPATSSIPLVTASCVPGGPSIPVPFCYYSFDNGILNNLLKDDSGNGKIATTYTPTDAATSTPTNVATTSQSFTPTSSSTSFDKINQGRCTDDSGHGRHGAFSTGISLVVGKLRQGCNWKSGNHLYITLPQFNLNNALTIATGLRLDAIGGKNIIASTKALLSGWELAYDGSAKQITFQPSNQKNQSKGLSRCHAGSSGGIDGISSTFLSNCLIRFITSNFLTSKEVQFLSEKGDARIRI